MVCLECNWSLVCSWSIGRVKCVWEGLGRLEGVVVVCF